MNRPNLFLALTALMLAPSFAARAADATAAKPRSVQKANSYQNTSLYP